MLLCLVVCLTLLASFFLPSHLSLKNMYIHVQREIHTHTHIHNNTVPHLSLKHVCMCILNSRAWYSTDDSCMCILNSRAWYSTDDSFPKATPSALSYAHGVPLQGVYATDSFKAVYTSSCIHVSSECTQQRPRLPFSAHPHVAAPPRTAVALTGTALKAFGFDYCAVQLAVHRRSCAAASLSYAE